MYKCMCTPVGRAMHLAPHHPLTRFIARPTMKRALILLISPMPWRNVVAAFARPKQPCVGSHGSKWPVSHSVASSNIFDDGPLDAPVRRGGFFGASTSSSSSLSSGDAAVCGITPDSFSAARAARSAFSTSPSIFCGGATRCTCFGGGIAARCAASSCKTSSFGDDSPDVRCAASGGRFESISRTEKECELASVRK